MATDAFDYDDKHPFLQRLRCVGCFDVRTYCWLYDTEHNAKHTAAIDLVPSVLGKSNSLVSDLCDLALAVG